jgi:hypothetical protein
MEDTPRRPQEILGVILLRLLNFTKVRALSNEVWV